MGHARNLKTMVLYCGKCGVQLAGIYSRVRLFSQDLRFLKLGAGFQCPMCGKAITAKWTEDWEKIENVGKYMKDKGNCDGFLHFDKNNMDDEPYCIECSSLMEKKEIGAVVTETRGLHAKGRIFQCPYCDYRIIRVNSGLVPAKDPLPFSDDKIIILS